jgi:hypothetical protein
MRRTLIRNSRGAVVAVETYTSRGRRLHLRTGQNRCSECGAYMSMTPDASGRTPPCSSCGWSVGDSLPTNVPLQWTPTHPITPDEQPGSLASNVNAQLVEIAQAYLGRRVAQQHLDAQAPPLASRTLDKVIELHKAAIAQGRVRG